MYRKLMDVRVNYSQKLLKIHTLQVPVGPVRQGLSKEKRTVRNVPIKLMVYLRILPILFSFLNQNWG